MTVLSLDTQQLFKTGGRQIRVKTKTQFLLKKRQRKKSCVPWFSSCMWVCGFMLFNIVPGIIFLSIVQRCTIHHAQLYKTNWYLFHVLWFTHCLYQCQNLSDDSCLRDPTAPRLMPFPWCIVEQKSDKLSLRSPAR